MFHLSFRNYIFDRDHIFLPVLEEKMFSLIRTCRVGTSLSRVWTRTFLLMDGKRVRFIIVGFFFLFHKVLLWLVEENAIHNDKTTIDSLIFLFFISLLYRGRSVVPSPYDAVEYVITIIIIKRERAVNVKIM